MTRTNVGKTSIYVATSRLFRLNFFLLSQFFAYAMVRLRQNECLHKTLVEIVVTAGRWTDGRERGCLTYRSVKVIQLVRYRLLNW